MSGRVNGSPSSAGKQGPMRATVPVALMHQDSSPTLCERTCPKAPTTICYDGYRNPFQRISPESKWSPGAKGKGRLLGCRRTASLDDLSGQWNPHSYCGRPMVERSTQTPEDWRELERWSYRWNTGDSLEMKYIRQRLQRTSPRSVQGEHQVAVVSGSPFCLQGPCTGPITIPASDQNARTVPLVLRMHNSVEGLNQEIERLVLKGISGNEAELVMGPTPEGHRAPIAELFHSTCSVDTQTPCDDDSFFFSPSQPTSPECNKSASSPEYEVSSVCKLGTSPQINKFLAREPPDGCEKVTIIDEGRKPWAGNNLDSTPSSRFVLRPSQRSAFCPLTRNPLRVRADLLNERLK